MSRANKLIADAEQASAGKGEAYYSGVLQALVRQLCAEVDDLQDSTTVQAAGAYQVIVDVELDGGCTARVLWSLEEGNEGCCDVRLSGNATLALGWDWHKNIPECVWQAVSKEQQRQAEEALETVADL